MQACRLIGSLQPLEQERCYRQLARKTGYPVEALKAQGEQSAPLPKPVLHRSASDWKNNQNAGTVAQTERFRAETALVGAMLVSREAAEAAVMQEAPELIATQAYRALSNAVIAAYAVDSKPNVAAIMAGMNEQDAALVGAALREDVELTDPVQAVTDCIRRMKRYDIHQRIQELTQSLSDPQMTKEEKTACLTQIQKLNREIRGA